MINSQESLRADLTSLGVKAGSTLMVHSSLGKVGWTVGGPVAVVRALLEALGPRGTLVMPAESPGVSDPAGWDDPRVKEEWHELIRQHLPVFDPATTPTTMGAIPEAFRTFPGTLRSKHPLVSVCAYGPLAENITAEHPLDFCEGAGSPFEKLFDLGSHTLLLGVGFNRCTSLHYAESLVPGRRTTSYRVPILKNAARSWVDTPQMGTDNGALFPDIGERFAATGVTTVGYIGGAETTLFETRALVDFARSRFLDVLS